jgi:mannose-6-phosphate isomerase-like protein (cupin superfamily)
MLISKKDDSENFGRTVYDICAENVRAKHFVVRKATKDHPFKPHKHEQEELWFILEGNAVAFEDGKEYAVAKGDLIHTASWVEHGLTTESEVSFICLG